MYVCLFTFFKCICAFNFFKKTLDYFPEARGLPISPHPDQHCVLTLSWFCQPSRYLAAFWKAILPSSALGALGPSLP